MTFVKEASDGLHVGFIVSTGHLQGRQLGGTVLAVNIRTTAD